MNDVCIEIRIRIIKNNSITNDAYLYRKRHALVGVANHTHGIVIIPSRSLHAICGLSVIV